MADDIGKYLSDYQQGNTDSGLLKLLQRLNLPLTSQTTEFLADEQDMAIASGRTGLFNGWSLPAGKDSRNDFFSLMTSAESYAAASGWQYFPTPGQMRWAAENGLAQKPQKQQWEWMASLNQKTAHTMPWLNVGMNQQQYQDFTTRLGDVWQQYTGSAAAPTDLMWKAAKENWSAQRFQQYVQNDPGVASQYGWVKHGMTYNDFQQYKLTNKQQAAQRFGAQAGDSQYLTMLDQPLTQANMQGTTVSAGSQQGGVAGAAGFGRSGEAR